MRTTTRSVGFSERATDTMRTAMAGSSSATTSTLARSAPTCSSVRCRLESPRSTVIPASSASAAPPGLSVVTRNGTPESRSTRDRRRAASP